MAHWVVENRPELLEGVTEGIGEVGASLSGTGQSQAALHDQTAQKGVGVAAAENQRHRGPWVADP